MSEIRVDTISEKTSANGVTIDGVVIKDNTIDVNGTAGALILDTDADTKIQASTDDNIEFLTGGAKQFNITNSGSIQAFRDSATSFGPSYLGQHQRGTIASPSIVSSGDRLVEFKSTAYDGTAYIDGPRISFRVDGTPGDDDMPSRIEFQTVADGANSLTERMRIHSGGVVSIPGGIELGSALDATAANVLDDYEEGTYAPVFTVASGSLTPHGSHNALAYTKIGRVVHVQGEVRFSAVSSPSGNFSVSLPFAVADLTDGAARSTSGAIGQSGFGGTPDATYYLRITSEGTTTALFATHNSGSDTGVNANQVSTSTEMILSFTFIAA